MLRRTSLFLALLCSIALSTQAEPSEVADIEREILTRFDSLVAAAKALDSDVYFDHFDRQSFSALNEDGTVTHSFESFHRDFLSAVESLKRYLSLEFERVKVTVLSPDTAILVNEYQATVELANGSVVEVAGAGSQVWHRQNGTWSLASISSSTKQR